MKGLSKNWIGVYKSAQNILVNFFHVGEKDLNFRFYWFVLSKMQIASTKTFWQEFHFVTMKHRKKFGQKLNRGFQISQIKLVNFSPAGEKGGSFEFHWFVLSKKQIAWTKSFDRSRSFDDFVILNGHERFRQKQNCGFQNSSPKNWWISIQQTRRVKFSRFIDLFYLKDKLPELKTLKGAWLCGTEWQWKIWTKT